MFIALLFMAGFAEEIPAIYKLSPHFSNAIGGGSLTVTAMAEPTTLVLGEGEYMTYSIAIGNVRNPSEVKRPTLDFPLFAVMNRDSQIAADRVVFRYILQPRTAEVTSIPSVRFDYYMPEAAEDRRLRTKYTEAIPIAVKPRTRTPHAVPQRFMSLVENTSDVSKSPSFLAWLAVPLTAMIVVPLWVGVWRHFNPQGARLARLLRHRAVRRAMQAIDRGEPVTAFRNYVHERFGIESWRSTPSELCESLRARGFSDDAVAKAEQLLREGDAARFGGACGDELASRAREAILAFEVTP